MARRKIRIAFVIGSLDVGGTEGQLVELVSRLDRDMFEPTVYCLIRLGPLANRLTSGGIQVRCLALLPHDQPMSVRLVAEHLPRVFLRTVGFAWALRRDPPNVIHGFLFFSYVLAAFVGRLATVPVVVASRRSLTTFKGRRRRYLWPEYLANRLTDLVIANSEAVRIATLNEERLSPGKVVVIHNGVDTVRFSPDRSAARKSLRLPATAWPVVAVVANFIQYKGHAIFIGSWARLVMRFPGAVALLVGDGPQRDELQARAHALGLAGTLRFLGHDSDVAAVLSSADMLVHPSSQEGFSNAILEAMAAGKPVIATNVGGNSEAVQHGVTGLLVPTGDADALAEAMISLAEQPDKVKKLGTAARRRAVDVFSLDAMVRNYERLYSDLAT